MAVYEEKGGYQDWAAKLDRDFGFVVNDYIAEYNDKSIEELSYVMFACIHHRLLCKNIKEKYSEINKKIKGI